MSPKRSCKSLPPQSTCIYPYFQEPNAEYGASYGAQLRQHVILVNTYSQSHRAFQLHLHTLAPPWAMPYDAQTFETRPAESSIGLLKIGLHLTRKSWRKNRQGNITWLPPTYSTSSTTPFFYPTLSPPYSTYISKPQHPFPSFDNKALDLNPRHAFNAKQSYQVKVN